MNKFNRKPNKARKGFSLVELMVAVSITTIIIGVLIGMTNMAVSTWKESSQKARSSRLAKEALEKLSKDFEGIVVRSGNNYEWGFAQVSSNSGDELGPSDAQMVNPMEIAFFSYATDRYDGQVGTQNDSGGDVSLVGYRLIHQDVINPGENSFPVFALYRDLVNPDEVFKDYLAQPNLKTTFKSEEVVNPENFLVENIYDLTVTLLFEYEVEQNGATTVRVARVPLQASGAGAKTVGIYGDRIEEDSSGGVDLSSARLAGAELSLTVLTDAGMRGLSRQKFGGKNTLAKYLRKHSHHYSRSVILPRP